jgi:hypothetical protein
MPRRTIKKPQGGQMADQPKGCARVTGAVLGEPSPEAQDSPTSNQPVKGDFMTARVGQKAPDFNAPAYFDGSFTNVQLSDHLGKWILLCFYPGDFTFV